MDAVLPRQRDRAAFWLMGERWQRAPPKYVRNPYIYFCQSNYGRFARILNTRMPQCIIRAAAQAWRNMPPDEKEPYVQMYKADIERYAVKKKNWAAQYEGRPPKYRKRNKFATTWLQFTPPKRYRTAFIWYHAAMRPKFHEKYPNWDGPELAQEMASIWRELSDKEKEPYRRLAKEDMDRYLKEMRVYRRAIFQQEAYSRIRNIQARMMYMREHYDMKKQRRMIQQNAAVIG